MCTFDNTNLLGVLLEQDLSNKCCYYSFSVKVNVKQSHYSITGLDRP